MASQSGALGLKVYSDRKWKILTNDSCRTLSGHFFAICVFIFHKTEVQTVILRCWTGLNLDWFKNYGLRRSLRLCASSANSKKIATAKWPCNDLARPFFANYIFIFHKTEIQTVILRCLTSLNLDWYRSYDTKRKNTKNTNVWFCTKPQKTWNGNICVLCPNFWTIQNLDQLNTSKWPSAPQFCERWTYTWQKTGWKW